MFVKGFTVTSGNELSAMLPLTRVILSHESRIRYRKCTIGLLIMDNIGIQTVEVNFKYMDKKGIRIFIK